MWRVMWKKMEAAGSDESSSAAESSAEYSGHGCRIAASVGAPPNLQTAEDHFKKATPRRAVDDRRTILDPTKRRVTSETVRPLQHWRHHPFQVIRSVFCPIEAVETAIWLTEVAPKLGKAGDRFLLHITGANEEANPDLNRSVFKLSTGVGKTTVMAMLIAGKRSTPFAGQTAKGSHEGL